MDTRIVEARKNITIARKLNDMDTFSAHIRIDFIPDEVIVKNITFVIKDPDAVVENAVASIYSELVDDYIGSFSDVPSGNCVTPNLTFRLERSISRLFNFDIMTSKNNTEENDMELQALTGNIAVHLEFVKYRTVKIDKIY